MTPPVPLRPVAAALWLAAGVLVAVSLASELLLRGLRGAGHHVPEVADGAQRFLAVNHEANLPTWFASGLLLLSAVVLAAIAGHHLRQGLPFGRRWALLAATFAYLSLDEAAQIHEKWGQITRLFAEPDVLYKWTVVGLVVVALAGLAFVGLLRAQPRRIRNLFLLSGGLYVGGALGFEILASVVNHRLGAAYDLSVTRLLLTHVEESLEMAGVILFLTTLLRYFPLDD